MAHQIRQYDIVRIIGMNGTGPQGIMGKRAPAIGDVACVVELYTRDDNNGYELECVSSQGEAEWVASFAAEEVALEFIESALSSSGQSSIP